MRSVGLNGKSVMPMISGFACAVPAVMTARNIENRKERLLTIMVITPLMSCSQPGCLYIPFLFRFGHTQSEIYLGVLSLQGSRDDGSCILLGIGDGAGSFLCNAKFFINIKEKSFFILELPAYRSAPAGKMLMTTMIEQGENIRI
jgi:ferrous iron transport protein B